MLTGEVYCPMQIRFIFLSVIYVLQPQNSILWFAKFLIPFLFLATLLCNLSIDYTRRLFLAHSATMNDGVDLPSQLLFSHPEIPDTFDEFLNTTTCTHTHTCNPPGPSASTHTHTCLHTHTQVFATGGEDDVKEDPTNSRRLLGNREAVRKYREKKKAHAAFLEEEVKKLRAANQQLLRRLQGHAALEAEVVRLRSLLFDVRGKIGAEIGAFPFQKQCSVGSVVCSDPTVCFNGNSEVGGVWEESSRAAAADCMINKDGDMSQEIDIPDVVHSMEDVASLVTPASLAE